MKAYETAWSKEMLDTLSGWGIGGNILHFIKNSSGPLLMWGLEISYLKPLMWRMEYLRLVSILICILFVVAINSITSDILFLAMCSSLPGSWLLLKEFSNLLYTVWINRAVKQVSLSPLQRPCVWLSRQLSTVSPSLLLEVGPIPTSRCVKFLWLLFYSRLTLKRVENQLPEEDVDDESDKWTKKGGRQYMHASFLQSIYSTLYWIMDAKSTHQQDQLPWKY